MGNTSDLENILDQCIEALIRGDSIEQCLARHSEYAGELEPLLIAALEVIAVPQPLPSPELKSETRRALHASLPGPEETCLQDALDHCVDLLIKGENVERCLQVYPNVSTTLGPLLTVASTVRQTLEVKPAPRFKRDALRRVLARAGRRRTNKWLPWVSWPRWAYRGSLVAAALLIMVSAGLFTVRASSDSAPHDILYPVKELSENVQMTLTTSREGEAKLHVELASRRAQEMADAAADGDGEAVGELLVKLEDHLEEASRLVKEKQIDEALELVLRGDEKADGEIDHAEVRELLATLGQDIKMNDARLKEAMNEASPDMNDEMDAAISQVRAHYVATIAALEDKRSSEDLDSLHGSRLTYRR